MKVPLRAYPTSTGYDLYAAESKILKAKERVLIKVELSFAISPGYCGRIIERSVLANVHGIVAFNGTVDADYRGTVCVLLFNLSDNKYKVEIGNQIAQLVIEKCYDVSFVEYNELPDMTLITHKTVRCYYCVTRFGKSMLTSHMLLI